MAANDIVLVVKADDKASGTFDKIAGKAKGLGGVLGGALKGGAIGGAAAVTGLGVAGVKMALDFEKSFGEVKTLLPDISEEAFGKLKSDVLAFSKEMGIATSDAIPALYQAISAGVPPQNVMEFMKTSAEASIGGVTDLETAVDGITSVVNAYGAETISAGQASDIMFSAVKAGKTDFEQLSGSLFNVIPTAASLGVSFEDVSAQLANLTAQGTPTSVATTQIRAAMVEASKSGTNLDLALKELTGKSFAALIESGETMPGIFNALRDSMPEQEFKDLFGSVEAMNAALGVTGPQFESTMGVMDGMKDSAGATGEAFDTMAETTSFKLDKAINLLKVTLTEIGLEVLPTLTDALAAAVPWLEENLPKAVKALEDAFAAVRPFLDSFIEGLGIIFPVLKDLVTFIIDNKPVLIAALAAIGVAVTLAFGPAGVATVALIGFIALLPQLGEIWAEVKETVMGVVEDLKQFLADNWQEILGVVLTFLTGPGGLVFLFTTNSFGIRDKVVEILGALPGLMLQIGSDFVQGLIGGALGRLTDLEDMAKSIVDTVLGGITSGFGIFSPSKEMFVRGQEVVNGLVEGIKSKETDVGQIMRELVQRAMGTFVEELNASSATFGSTIIPPSSATFGSTIIPPMGSGVEKLQLLNSLLTGVGTGTGGLLELRKRMDAAIAGGGSLGPGFMDLSRAVDAILGGDVSPEAMAALAAAFAGSGFASNIQAGLQPIVVNINAIDGASVEAVAPQMAHAIQEHLQSSGSPGMLTA